MAEYEQVNVRFAEGEDADLFRLLNQYRVSQGWTWKRFILIGIANTISKQGDNPNLVLEIANHLEKRR